MLKSFKKREKVIKKMTSIYLAVIAKGNEIKKNRKKTLKIYLLKK